MSATTTFRKASDTRTLPESPSSIANLREYGPKTSINFSNYGPRIGQTGLPLTPSQAEQIIDASGFPDRLSKYKQKFIETLVSESANVKQYERRSFENLLEKAKHPCSIESMSDAYDKLENRLKSIEVEDFGEENKRQFISGTFRAPAIYLAYGYDILDKSHFIFDEDGNIVDINRTNKDRKPLCLNKVRSENLLRQQSTQFTKFVKEQSDAYKGSQQGTGKTRKHKKHVKKTLRRRKVRRNVH